MGWNVSESQVVQEWQAEARAEGEAKGRLEGKAEGKVEGRAEGRAEGRVEARVEAVLEALEARFGSVPADLVGRVRATAELAALKRWLALAVRAATLDEFRRGAQV